MRVSQVFRRSSVLTLVLAFVGCEQLNEVSLTSSAACAVIGTPQTLPDEVSESSGAVFASAANDVIWTHNDSGGDAAVYALNRQGRVIATVGVTGAENDDWEDIAAGPCAGGRCLFIADIGDNSANRRQVTIYSIPEPSLEDQPSAPATAYHVRYPDGPRDAEALFIIPDDGMYIVSKGGDDSVGLYRYPGELNPGETVTLEAVRTLSSGPVPLGDRVTGATVTPDGQWVLIRTYTTMLAYRAARVAAAGTESERIDLMPIAPGQGEGIAAGPEGRVALTSEAIGGIPGAMVMMECPFLLETALAEALGHPEDHMARDSRRLYN